MKTSAKFARQIVQSSYEVLFSKYVTDHSIALHSLSNKNVTLEMIEQIISNGIETDEIGQFDMFSYISRNPNVSLEFIEKYKNEPLEWDYLSRSHAVTLEFITKHPNLDWNWVHVSCRKDLTFEIIMSNLELPWEWLFISNSYIVSEQIVFENPYLPWSFPVLSSNPSITVDFIIRTPNFPWDFQRVLFNPNVTMDFIKKYVSEDDRDMELMTLAFLENNPETILENPDLPWNFQEAHEARNLSLDTIRLFIDRDWNWNDLTNNPSVTLEFVSEFPEKNWNFTFIGYKSGLTIEFLRKYQLEIDFSEGVMLNRSITPQMIDSNPDLPWKYEQYEMNPNLTLEYVITHPDREWNWDELSDNSAMSPIDIATTYFDKPWLSYNILDNSFSRFETELMLEIARTMHRTGIITEELIQRVAHPSRVKFGINQFSYNYGTDSEH